MKNLLKKILVVFAILLLLETRFMLVPTSTNAALLTSASVQLSDPRPSQATTTYTIVYTFPSTTSIQCIDVIFSDTTAHITLTANPATTAPAGMTTTSSVYGGTVGGGLTSGNWTLYHNTNGILQFEDGSGQASTATQITITATTITNPSAATFYAQVATYTTLTTHTCSGLADNSNVMALATTNGVAASVSVDPTISFAISGSSGAINGGPTSNAITTGSSIAFGTVAAGGSASSAAQLLTTSTNAANGYYIYIRDTQALTDANSDTITAQTGTPASPNNFSGSTSTSAFGFTSNSTTVSFGSNKWAGLTTTNVSIDHQTAPQNAATLSVEYQLQLSNTQAPGSYSNVITYTATPVY